MSIEVNPEWWKTLFDDIYLLTDARSVCDDRITRKEVDLLLDLLPIRQSHRIMDLCGGHGRHTFDLHRRGFTGCCLLDYSESLIEKAKSTAKENNISIDCIQADARDTGLPEESFDGVLILGNSLGYLPDPVSDVHILTEAARIMRKGGWLAVDVTDGEMVRSNFSPSAWHEIGEDTVVCRQRELGVNTIRAREMVLSKEKGLLRDRTYEIRLYSPERIRELFETAGFCEIDVYADISTLRKEEDEDYGFMNHRMIATGRKR